MYLMQEYDDALRNILENGERKKNRTGIDTLWLPSLTTKYNLSTEYFPLGTKRKLWPKSTFAELLWFLAGENSIDQLEKRGCGFWSKWRNDEWTNKVGLPKNSLGGVYGFILRFFSAHPIRTINLQHQIENETDHNRKEMLKVYLKEELKDSFDQLEYILTELKTNKFSRRILFSLWAPNYLQYMRLPPCHYTGQFLVNDNNELTSIITQRSCDYPVGIYSGNIPFYALFTILLAYHSGLKPKQLIHHGVDCHIYENQVDAVKEYLSRKETPDSPKLKINWREQITDYVVDDFELIDYNPLNKISIEVLV